MTLFAEAMNSSRVTNSCQASQQMVMTLLKALPAYMMKLHDEKSEIPAEETIEMLHLISRNANCKGVMSRILNYAYDNFRCSVERLEGVKKNAMVDGLPDNYLKMYGSIYAQVDTAIAEVVAEENITIRQIQEKYARLANEEIEVARARFGNKKQKILDQHYHENCPLVKNLEKDIEEFKKIYLKEKILAEKLNSFTEGRKDEMIGATLSISELRKTFEQGISDIGCKSMGVFINNLTKSHMSMVINVLHNVGMSHNPDRRCFTPSRRTMPLDEMRLRFTKYFYGKSEELPDWVQEQETKWEMQRAAGESFLNFCNAFTPSHDEVEESDQQGIKRERLVGEKCNGRAQGHLNPSSPCPKKRKTDTNRNTNSNCEPCSLGLDKEAGNLRKEAVEFDSGSYGLDLKLLELDEEYKAKKKSNESSDSNESLLSV